MDSMSKSLVLELLMHRYLAKLAQIRSSSKYSEEVVKHSMQSGNETSW